MADRFHGNEQNMEYEKLLNPGTRGNDDDDDGAPALLSLASIWIPNSEIGATHIAVLFPFCLSAV